MVEKRKNYYLCSKPMLATIIKKYGFFRSSKTFSLFSFGFVRFRQCDVRIMSVLSKRQRKFRSVDRTFFTHTNNKNLMVIVIELFIHLGSCDHTNSTQITAPFSFVARSNFAIGKYLSKTKNLKCQRSAGAK